MQRFAVRRCAIAAVSLLALSGFARPAWASSYHAAGLSSITDPTGDVIDDSTMAVLSEPKADITAASAEYRTGEIALTLTVSQFSDPRTDPNWADAASLAAWALDTNNDGNVDYVVALVGSTGTVAAGAAAIDHPDQILCTGAATADQSTRTYSAVIPSSCVGSPASFHWGAIMRYDTNPADSHAPVALDLTPDGNSDMAGPVAAPTDPSVSTAGAHDGYWMLTKSGTIFGFGSASNNGVTDQLAFTHIEPTPSGNGYWVLTEGGRIIPKGDAINLPTVGMQPGERAVSLSSTPSGSGLWVFTDKGRVIPLGDAQFFGDMSHTPLNGSILGSVATPTGKGYWMVGSDGGIFSFGDAKFHGSTGNMKLNQPVMAMAPAPDGSGYWLVAADGGIFAFDVPFYGSMGGTPLNKPISSMVPGQGGYMMVAQDGGIFSFGSVAFHGSLGANPPASPVVSVALQP